MRVALKGISWQEKNLNLSQNGFDAPDSSQNGSYTSSTPAAVVMTSGARATSASCCKETTRPVRSHKRKAVAFAQFVEEPDEMFHTTNYYDKFNCDDVNEFVMNIIRAAQHEVAMGERDEKAGRASPPHRARLSQPLTEALHAHDVSSSSRERHLERRSVDRNSAGRRKNEGNDAQASDTTDALTTTTTTTTTSEHRTDSANATLIGSCESFPAAVAMDTVAVERQHLPMAPVDITVEDCSDDSASSSEEVTSLMCRGSDEGGAMGVPIVDITIDECSSACYSSDEDTYIVRVPAEESRASSAEDETDECSTYDDVNRDGFRPQIDTRLSRNLKRFASIGESVTSSTSPLTRQSSMTSSRGVYDTFSRQVCYSDSDAEETPLPGITVLMGDVTVNERAADQLPVVTSDEADAKLTMQVEAYIVKVLHSALQTVQVGFSCFFLSSSPPPPLPHPPPPPLLLLFPPLHSLVINR